MLLNPAFMGFLAHQVAAGFQQEGEVPLPFPLVFVAVAAVLHGPTRDVLPRAVSTSLPAWLEAHPELLVQFPERAVRLVPATRAGILLASRLGAMALKGGGLVPLPLQRRWKSEVKQLPVDEVERCGQAAAFVGRWFARAGTPQTVMSMWGVRP